MAYQYAWWLYAVLLISFIFVIIATIMCFFAPSYIVDTNSTSTAANHQTARSLLYGAGVIGIIIIIMLIWSMFSFYNRNVEVSTAEAINAAFFGTGTLIFALLLLLLVIFMIFLIFYALTLIDSGSTARWWALVAGVLMIIALILVAISFWFYYDYNRYLSTLLLPVDTIVEPITYPLADDMFYVTKNPNKPGFFDGVLSIQGSYTTPSVYVDYGNGRGYTKNASSMTIADSININENIVETTVPVQQTVVKNVPVEQTVVKNVPVEQTVVKNVPVQQTVVKNVPVQQTVVKNVPVQQTVVKNVPVPARKVPVQTTIETRSVPLQRNVVRTF